MIRSALGKVVWVGRTASMVFGLALVMALVLGVASMALGANGKPFLLGKTNVATAVSTLVKKGAGPALSLKVGAGQPPLAVNSSARVANLNAAKAGQADSAGFATNAQNATNAQSAANADTATNAGNADTLDGKDASAFGIKTSHNFSFTDTCDTPNTLNQCAQVQVTVPADKTYLVSVWSSFTAKGGTSNQDVTFCSAKRDPGQAAPSCITPFGVPSKVTVPANQFAAAASSGETLSLSEGTYVFSTAINPTAQFTFDDFGKAITKVLVRDASGATVTSASVSKLGAASQER
jgi:hypothetical protein